MLAGRKDALSSIGVVGGFLATSPLFAGFPLTPFMASAFAGCAWLGWKTTSGYRERHIDTKATEKFVIPSDEPFAADKDDSILLGLTTDYHKECRGEYSAFQRHTAIIGQSGVGKTTVAEFILWSQISRGGGYIFIDPKLDHSQRNKMYYMAKILGREDEFYVINVGDPANSNTYNPILSGDPDEVASRLMNLIPSTESNAGADHYKQTASYALTVIIAGLKRANKLYTFGDLSILLQSSQAIESLMRIIPESAEKRSLEIFLDQYRKRTKEGSQIDTDRLKTALGGIAGRIAMFAQGKFGEVFNTVTPDVNLYDVVINKKMLYVMLPTMGKDISALNLGKLVISDLRSACSSLQELPESERPYPPCIALLDEFNSIVNEGISRLFEQARSAGIALLPCFQSFGGLRRVSPDFAEQIIQNTWIKVIFKFGSKEAEEASELFGKFIGIQRSLAFSQSESSGSQLLRTDPNATDSDGAGMGETFKEQEELRVSPDKIRALGMGEAFCMIGARAFHLKTPMLHFPEDIPNYRLIKPVRKAEEGKTSLNYDKKYKDFLMGSSEPNTVEQKAAAEKPESTVPSKIPIKEVK
jgi:intracellular multiplication protein IcmO